jgi:hypothetical protein
MYNTSAFYVWNVEVKGKMYRSGRDLYILEAWGALTSC